MHNFPNLKSISSDAMEDFEDQKLGLIRIWRERRRKNYLKMEQKCRKAILIENNRVEHDDLSVLLHRNHNGNQAIYSRQNIKFYRYYIKM